MAYLKVHDELITQEVAKKLMGICPFSAITYENDKLEINGACKLCKLCVKKGPKGAVEFVDESEGARVDKQLWRGIAVYADHSKGVIHNVTLELIGKARELARVIEHPVYAVLIGYGVDKAAKQLLKYGVDKVFVYDDPRLEDFRIEPYTNAFEDFIRRIMPSTVMVGATNLGRTLAPRLAARFRTGLTADCTSLEMKENTDLVQIRPAFGGNIMAQIVTPNSRPQFCTVRYKVFSAPEPVDIPSGKIVNMKISDSLLKSSINILNIAEKKKEMDISEAEVIVAIGRGIKSKEDLALIRQLADMLGAQIACTRPLIECGWFDAKHQIGLSGRTVKAKLIIAIGISGSVQFIAGMRNSDCIIAINSDPGAAIFDVAHFGLAGDLYEILPRLIAKYREEGKNGT